MNKKNVLLLYCMLLAVTNSLAQDDRIHFGILGGYRLNSVNYSNLDKNYFPDPKGISSAFGGIFAEFEFGKEGVFSIRPELMYLSRGHKISGLNYAQGTGVGELSYSFKPSFLDIRVPLIVNIGNHNAIRPYFYLAPIFGLPTGGEIEVKDAVSSIPVDISKANIATTYFAAAIGGGVKFPVNVGPDKIHIGIEANYQFGLTDTYGSKEKDGKAIARQFFPIYNITGTRKLSGIEIGATVSVPLSLFKSKGAKKDVPVVVQERIVERQVVNEERPCYDLEEILDMAERGEKVSGKTICAIDQINFEYNKSTLTRNSRAYLDKISQLMKKTKVSIEVKGHTDGQGSDEFNMKLSKERAEAVYYYLLSKGVSEKKLDYSYYGKRRPIATNNTEEGRRKNRRVEFEIK